MTNQEKPIGIAMIICDRVITEEHTHNKTIVSTFNSIAAARFPCRHPRLSVYVALTNAKGKKRVELTCQKEGKRIFETAGEMDFPGPNHVIELIFDLLNLPLREPGPYAFEISVDEEYIFERQFNVLQQAPVPPNT